MKKLILKLSKLSITAIFVSCLMVSCVSVPKIGNLKPIYVTNMKQINLLPTSSIDSDVDTMMQLQGTFGNQTFTVLTYVQADENGIFMSLMNDFGTEMGDMTYDGFEVNFESAMFPDNLPAEYIINDFQNAFYKTEDLKKNLTASKLNFVITEKEGTEIRQVLDGKKVIEEIVLSEDNVLIKNILRGYEFNLIISE